MSGISLTSIRHLSHTLYVVAPVSTPRYRLDRVDYLFTSLVPRRFEAQGEDVIPIPGTAKFLLSPIPRSVRPTENNY